MAAWLWMRRWLTDETGLEEVEIGIVASMIVLIGAVIFVLIGNDSEVSLFALEGATQSVANQSGS